MENISCGAYSRRKDLTEFTIPDGVAAIGSSAFEDCTNLKAITFPPTVTKIGSWAFAGCSSLKSILLPKKVQEIGASAFADCICLKQVQLPDGLKAIGGNAFYHCMSLRKLHIPESATQIDPDVFGWRTEAFLNAESYYIPNVELSRLRPEARIPYCVFYLTTRREHSQTEQEAYEAYMRLHFEEVIQAVFQTGNMEALLGILELQLITAENIEACMEYASRQKMTEVLAFLMEYKEKQMDEETARRRAEEWEL